MLSWEQVTELSKKVAGKIRKSGFAPDYLIGITVGGLIPLGLLAEELGIRNILTVSAGSYTGRDQGGVEITYLPDMDFANRFVHQK